MAVAKSKEDRLTEFFSSVRFRYFLLVLALITVVGIYSVRLWYLQIIKHDDYVEMALESRTKETPIRAERGEVYMMNGSEDPEAVIMNERVWDVYIDPKYAMSFGDENVARIEKNLTEILGDKMKVSWNEVWKDKDRQYIEIAKAVDYETAAKIKAVKNLHAVGMNSSTRRVYPSGNLASQLLGFINVNGDGYGIEGGLNSRLAGKDGKLKAVVDVNQIPLSIGDEYAEVPAVDGEDIVLTVDINIQRKVESILAERVEKNANVATASALVMDPMTGKVMAMANYPNFDPENYGKVEDASIHVNRITSSLYEPASVIKPFVYAMALNEGKIKLSDTYNNMGSTVVADRRIYNARHSMRNLGEITFQTAIDNSLNTGSIEVLRRVGGGDITKAARKTMYDYFVDGFGLGRKTGIEVHEEQGIIISPEEVQGNAVRYSNMTFGQGMSVTMMQVATGFCSMVNGGSYIQPTLVEGTLNSRGQLVKSEEHEEARKTISADTSVEVRKMLAEVRKYNGGSHDPEGYNIGIKTGTAETLDENGHYTSDKTNASVIGYGGSGGEDDIPKYVIMVRLDGNSLLWGATDAVPVFTDISNYLIDYLRIPPSL